MTKLRPGIIGVLLAGLLALAACGSLPPGAQAGSEAAPPVTQSAAPTEPEADSPVPTPGASLDQSTLPPAALAAQVALAGQIGVAAQDVSVVSVEPVDWPDSCLGAEQPGEMCAAVITPGYKVVLSASGKSYEIHTNDDGSNFRVVEVPATSAGATIIGWQGIDDTGACVTAEISADGTAYGKCGASELARGPLTFGGRPSDLEMLRTAYAPFAAETPVGEVVFAGSGRQAAGPSEQRMIAERARSAFYEARSGASAVGTGLALQLYQEGGIAGICRNVSVYLMGFAYVVDCSARPAQVLDAILLDSGQLEQLYLWTDALGRLESTHIEGDADVMTSTVSFFGASGGQPSDSDKQAMEAFALNIAASAQGLAVAAGCPVATNDLELYRNFAFGFCFLYPPTVAEATDSMTTTVFVAGGDLMNHVDARLSVEVVNGGGAAADAADAFVADILAAMPDFPLERSNVSMAGVEAAQIDRVPGQDFSRVIFVSNGDLLLKLTFTPSDPEVAGYAGMQALYDTVVESFAFAQ